MEDRVDIPTSWWERLVADRRRLLAFVAGVLVVVLVAGAIVMLAVRGARDRAPLDDGRNEPIAEEPSRTPQPDPSTTETDSAGATSAPSGADGAVSPDPGAKPVVRASLVAYRLDGVIWVAGEDGSKPREVVALRAGSFALSPDGTVLACVDVAERRLMLVDVQAGTGKDVGPALDAGLSWAPDSSFLAYTARVGGKDQVVTVERDGAGPATLGTGHSPHVSPDGAVVAWVSDGSPGQPGPLALRDPRAKRAVSVSKDLVVYEAAFGGDGIVAVVPRTGSGQALATAPFDASAGALDAGARPRTLEFSPSGPKPAALTGLCPDVTGRYVLLAESGDDGYSRAYVFDLVSGQAVALSVRRDTYPVCWNSVGKKALFVEGNAFQGEATALMEAGPDGLGRRVVIEGAGL